jgi:hypothetical protein
VKFTEYLKYTFTDAEITDAAKELARAAQQRTSLEQRKKEVDSQLKADIEAQNSIVGRLSSYINTGYEYRDIECRVELDTPEQGKKRIVRLDTEEEVKVVPMTDMDRQMRLELQEKADAADAEKEKAKEPIVTPPPIVLQLPEPEPAVAPLASVTVMGGSHQKRERRKRNPEAEAFADGSGE